jgi:hypothetical protein
MMIHIDALATGNEGMPSIGKFHSTSKELANATYQLRLIIKNINRVACFNHS